MQPLPPVSDFFYVVGAAVLVVVVSYFSMRTHIASRKSMRALELPAAQVQRQKDLAP
jgi:hypothetical protein